MAKTIKFDLRIDGVEVATLDDLRDHFTTEIIEHFRSGLLARWLRSRSVARELAAVEALASDDDDAATLKELCRIFEVQASDGVIAAAVAKATGVQKRVWRPGYTFQDCRGCPQLVVVPSGSFMMGSPEEEEDSYDNESPLHKVMIDYQFAVGVYPVTFDEWNACVSGGGCGGYEPDDEGWGRGRRPVINVSWDDVKMYVGWLSWRTGKGYRLLNESEWEYVARAGTVTSYWWGDEIGWNRANCNGCGNRSWYNEKTSPVGSFSENGFGLYDVHGNVWEWVEDCQNGSYDGAPTDGSAWESEDRYWRNELRHRRNESGFRFEIPPIEVAPISGSKDRCRRMVRGGSWSSESRDLRSASRDQFTAWDQRHDVGFRVARTLD